MESPKISIVIPTHNRARYLQQAIASALGQTIQDFEIIISDDASSDNTAEVVHGFADSRIRYHRHSINKGITSNWQFVISQARAEWIAPLADDDLFLPEHLETAWAALERYPGAAYYTCPAEYFGLPIAAGYYRPKALADNKTPLIYCAPERAVDFLGTDNPGPLNSMVCRRRALHNQLFWGPPGYLPQDLLIMTQLMVQGGFVFGNRSLTRFRVHESNTSLQRTRKSRVRFNLMAWYGVRWLAQFLLGRQLCTLEAIEAHGQQATDLERHVAPLVLGLGSSDSPPALCAVARRVFEGRTDVDRISARFRLARRLGFWTIPVAEKISQFECQWHP